MPAIQDHGSSDGGRGGFPGLGFDPTPGNVDAVVAVTDQIRTARARLDECAPRLAKAIKDADDWKGPAANDFHRFGDDLPKGMIAGAQSMATVQLTLTAWANVMTANQRQADVLEAAAKRFRKDLEHAEAQARDTASRAAYAHGSERAHAEKTAEDARDEYDRIAGLLEEIIKEARGLEKRHSDKGKATAAAVRNKADGAFAPVTTSGATKFFDTFANAADDAAKFGTNLAKAALKFGVNDLAEQLDKILPGGRNVAKFVALQAALNPFAQGAKAATVASGVGINLAAGQVKPFAELGQYLSGSAHAPRWWELGIDLALTKVPIKGARGLARGAVERALLGGTRKEVGKGALRVGGKRAKAALGEVTGVQQYRKLEEFLEHHRATGSLTEALGRKHEKDLLDKGASALGGQDAKAEDLIKHHRYTENELRAAGERAVIREYLAKAAEGVLPEEAGKYVGIVIDPNHLDKATDYGLDKTKKKDEN